jgi:peroxiredoxin
LAGFEKQRAALEALGAKVVAASVDPLDKAQVVAAEVSYPIGYGATRETAEEIGGWWEERRRIIQPSEFIIGTDGRVIASTYSSGPLGRMDAAEVVRLITSRETQVRG